MQLAAFVPSHVPAHAPLPVQEGRLPCGAPATAVHAPTLPTASHASHWPVQAELQHTPSTQWPELHSASLKQPVPFATCATHTPAAHQVPAAQSALEAQLPAHEVEPHVYGEQLTVCSAWQAPSPSQWAASVAVPPVQLASRQSVPAPG